MLSDDSLEKLMKPMIDRQENINNYVLSVIGKRIKDIGALNPSDLKRLKVLMDMGSDVRAINKELAKVAGLQVQDVKKIIKTAALDSYLDTKPFYDYRHKSFIPLHKNKPLQSAVDAVAKETANTFVNLSNSKATGFYIRDLKHPTKLKFQTIPETYRSVIDEAIQAVQSGAVDYETAIRRTVKQLADSGLRRLYWDSGYTQRLDTAVRRNIKDGVKAINQRIQDEAGKQFGADGKEISVHRNSAPDHEPVQGHQFTNEEFEKLQSDQPFKNVRGRIFEPIRRAIGMWNCYHYTFSIIIGVTPPKYTARQLSRIKEDNKRGYKLPDGRRLTKYECTQELRKLETKIRYAKDGQMLARTTGDIQLAKEYQAKVDKYTKIYEKLAKIVRMSTKPERTSVPGFHRISTN